jgi:16S rRNA (guanine966-N2)-methyltransferase
MRIVGGALRGKALTAPAGSATRPTADRVRQALFDMLWHAPWAGRAVVEGAHVLDAFAGTGALGLEALSRGAAHAIFVENDSAALASLRANIAASRLADRCTIEARDALALQPGRPCALVFLDPPYGKDLVPLTLSTLVGIGRLAPGALVVAELGRGDPTPNFGEVLAERTHGAARLVFLRASLDPALIRVCRRITAPANSDQVSDSKAPPLGG